MNSTVTCKRLKKYLTENNINLEYIYKDKQMRLYRFTTADEMMNRIWKLRLKEIVDIDELLKMDENPIQ